MDEDRLADLLATTLRRYASMPAYRRFLIRVKELGENQKDETLQAHTLQRLCRDVPALAADLAAAGFGDVVGTDLHHVTPEGGRLVQAFNRLVEEGRLAG